MPIAHQTREYAFLREGGEMGRLMRACRWEQTSLGTPDGWPQSLRTTLSIILNSKFPMFLFWGPELLCFYNDAYRPSLGNEGKHPNALGSPAAEVWEEIWDVIEPLITQVLAGGEATWSEDQLIPIYRNRRLEDVYWTFSYSPVSDESGQIAGVFVTCTETTKAVQSRQALLHSEKRFHSLVAQAPVAIALLLGTDFVVEFINHRMLDYWDRSLAQVLNKPVFEGLHEARAQGFEALLVGVLTTGQAFISKELSINLLRGGEFHKMYIDFIYEPYYGADQTIQGVMVMVNDITEQVVARQQIEEQVQQRTHELDRAIADLRRSNESLDQFAHVASHDLQEPLRKIHQFSALLRSQYSTQLGDGVDYLNRVQTAAGRMSTLIHDLLAYARISALADTPAMVSLMGVVHTVLMDLELAIQESGAVVTIDSLPNVEGIESQINQLFQNLLGNALKFRRVDQSGTPVLPLIRISAQILMMANLPDSLKPMRLATTYHRIDVSDNGIGFDEQYADEIFQVFRRLHGKNHYSGTGIGLAICQKVAANHGGAVTASSQPGQGATFSVYFPV